MIGDFSIIILCFVDVFTMSYVVVKCRLVVAMNEVLQVIFFVLDQMGYPIAYA